jgi:hypothetical protein
MLIKNQTLGLYGTKLECIYFGWATMPYEKKPDREVAEKCTEMILQSSE